MVLTGPNKELTVFLHLVKNPVEFEKFKVKIKLIGVPKMNTNLTRKVMGIGVDEEVGNQIIQRGL